ncbi:MAG TPA: beta-N-acetylhexosaminidase [Gemmatimonadaceae bacterium]|nr:beta-N-acetylhexosaminidase [Gemmatimonadaceae bacterium]
MRLAPRAFLVALATAVGCAPATRPVTTTPRPLDPGAHAVIPRPVSIELSPTEQFTIDSTTTVVIASDATADVERVARVLAAMIAESQRPGAAEPRRLAAGDPIPARSIALRLDPSRPLGAEGYELESRAEGVTLTAAAPAGLFYAVQTLRQLLPVAVEHPAAYRRVLRVPAARVRDVPRFAWRGAMLDVSRHFLPAADVRRFIDHMTLYKLNRLHLHLSDDQGWRVEIRSWPRLTEIGGSTQVGGGKGGYYTQAELAELVRYAADRFITVVPEFDMPGHTNAALASYAGLNCDGRAPERYTGIRVGFSAICVDRDSTYRFVEDVVREVGAITGPWFHIGGDEVEKLTHAQYVRFIERVQGIVRAQGKTMIGWGEIAPAALDTTTIVQHWRAPDSTAVHAARGGRVILSPGPRAYFDMKYDSATVLGLRWAGLIPVQRAYDWDPATQIAGVAERSILGVEGPLWSETLFKREDVEFMAFPRLAALAEVGWSAQDQRRWEDFAARLGAHGPRLDAMGVNFHRAAGVPWQ